MDTIIRKCVCACPTCKKKRVKHSMEIRYYMQEGYRLHDTDYVCLKCGTKRNGRRGAWNGL